MRRDVEHPHQSAKRPMRHLGEEWFGGLFLCIAQRIKQQRIVISEVFDAGAIAHRLVFAMHPSRHDLGGLFERVDAFRPVDALSIREVGGVMDEPSGVFAQSALVCSRREVVLPVLAFFGGGAKTRPQQAGSWRGRARQLSHLRQARLVSRSKRCR